MGIWLWLKIGHILRPLASSIQKLEKVRLENKMTVNANYLIQVIALLLQTLNQLAAILPPKGQFWATVIITGLQGVSAVLAHFKNPDGTTAKVAWEKEGK